MTDPPGVLVRWECEFCGREGEFCAIGVYECWRIEGHPTRSAWSIALGRVVEARVVGRCKPVRYVREDPA